LLSEETEVGAIRTCWLGLLGLAFLYRILTGATGWPRHHLPGFDRLGFDRLDCPRELRPA
jgi:hypothetical protein